jgi:hypothetical protein
MWYSLNVLTFHLEITNLYSASPVLLCSPFLYVSTVPIFLITFIAHALLFCTDFSITFLALCFIRYTILFNPMTVTSIEINFSDLYSLAQQLSNWLLYFPSDFGMCFVTQDPFEVYLFQMVFKRPNHKMYSYEVIPPGMTIRSVLIT